MLARIERDDAHGAARLNDRAGNPMSLPSATEVQQQYGVELLQAPRQHQHRHRAAVPRFRPGCRAGCLRAPRAVGLGDHGSLPVAGESELLRRRMRGTPAEGNLHAKTGTTDTVVGLGGYVTAKDGEIVAFSFIYNGNDRWNAKATMDAMGATLANFVRE